MMQRIPKVKKLKRSGNFWRRWQGGRGTYDIDGKEVEGRGGGHERYKVQSEIDHIDCENDDNKIYYLASFKLRSFYIFYNY